MSDFGWAITQLRLGKRVRRKNWFARNSYLMYIDETLNSQVKQYKKFVGDAPGIVINGFIAQLTPHGQVQPGWAPSQVDAVADDWEEAEPLPAVTAANTATKLEDHPKPRDPELGPAPRVTEGSDPSANPGVPPSPPPYDLE